MIIRMMNSDFLSTDLWGQKAPICWITLLITAFIFYPVLANSQPVVQNGFESFNVPTDGWIFQGDAEVNPLKPGSFKSRTGKNILVGNTLPDGLPVSFSSKRNYGDVIVEFDILMSHNASGAVFLQGQYGVRLADSWGESRVNLGTNGAIIPSGEKGASTIGYLPSENISRAPGTWQHVKMEFEAPQFNSAGDKIKPARLVSFEQNGLVVQEYQYLPVPSKKVVDLNDQAEGPLTFQVTEGQLALKNIEVTEISKESVQLENLSYQLYQGTFLQDDFIYWGGTQDTHIPIPDLIQLQADEEGDIDQINTQMIRGKSNDFAISYKGNLHIPISGEYTFEVIPNGIGSFELNGEERIRWNVLHNKGNTSFKVTLQKGVHSIRQLYVNYGQPRAGLYVEGPGLKQQALHDGGQIPSGSSVEPLVLTPANSPLLQRSFLYHNEQKLLTCMNVGSPKGVHYSVNMANGALVQVWRGKFGDVTQMWHGRGEGQVLQPLGSILSFDAKQQVLLDKQPSTDNTESEDFRRDGYDLNASGDPVFLYSFGALEVRDHIRINKENNTLTRSLRFRNPGRSVQNAWYRLATSSSIEQVTEGLYAINGKSYFIEIDQTKSPEIHDNGNQQQLLVPLQVETEPERLTYSIIW